MVPQRFQKKTDVKCPAELHDHFQNYENGHMSDERMAHFLREWVELFLVDVDVRYRLLEIASELQKDVDARELCKRETNIAAVPPLMGKKFFK